MGAASGHASLDLRLPRSVDERPEGCTDRLQRNQRLTGRDQENQMATMCPIDGCKAKQGLCIHDKLMIVMGVMLLALAIAHWGLGVF